MHFRVMLHDLGGIHQVNHKRYVIYMLCIWYSQIIIIIESK